MMTIRPYTDRDLDAAVDLFTASVHGLGAAHYSALQRNAWAPRPPDLGAWADRFAALETVLLVEENGLAGFISFDGNGHIELLYTAPNAVRRGVASALLNEVERRLSGMDLFTEASAVAKPFFLHHGFDVIQAQQVVRRGVAFDRFAMHKRVVSPSRSGVV